MKFETMEITINMAIRDTLTRKVYYKLKCFLQNSNCIDYIVVVILFLEACKIGWYKQVELVKNYADTVLF